MRQVVPNKFSKKVKKKVVTNTAKKKINKEKYGTSKLEYDFAKEFLDKNDIVYIYQYEAKEIGRYFDFAVSSYRDKTYIKENKDGINCVKQDGQYFEVSFFIEVDGDYW